METQFILESDASVFEYVPSCSFMWFKQVSQLQNLSILI